MNYYELLDVPKNATTDEIKKHYRKYAKIHHPDKGGDPEKFKDIQLPLDYKKKKSQFIIKNNFTNKSVKKGVEIILKEIL